MSTNYSSPKPSKPTESEYAKRQRRRAERIIAATGVYSGAFRDEVQEALSTFPYKLPVLFREADRIDQRLASAGRSFRAGLRKAGVPISEGPVKRSPKNTRQRHAEMIEALFVARDIDELDESTAKSAQLISNILYDIGNESGIDATHPQLVKAYVLGISEKLTSLDRHSYEQVQTAFDQIRDLMNGCSPARYEEIDRYYNPDREDRPAEVTGTALGSEDEAVEADGKLEDLRQKLLHLERVPENEAITFQLESEIFQYERENATADEWPDVIG
jgi:hypothetical protein